MNKWIILIPVNVQLLFYLSFATEKQEIKQKDSTMLAKFIGISCFSVGALGAIGALYMEYRLQTQLPIDNRAPLLNNLFPMSYIMMAYGYHKFTNKSHLFSLEQMNIKKNSSDLIALQQRERNAALYKRIGSYTLGACCLRQLLPLSEVKSKWLHALSLGIGWAILRKSANISLERADKLLEKAEYNNLAFQYY